MTASSDLDALEARLSADIQAASDLAALDALRVGALGKKGEVSLKMRELGKMSPEERQVMGPALNGLKDRLNTLLETRKATLEDAAMNAALASESVDVTRPVKREAQGSLHPVAQVMEELAVIFADMGFAVAEGPDVEDDFHNFTALNFPPDHPARDTHDTFFMKAAEGETAKVLRTHTSPVQIRTMLKTKPPIRIIAPGRVYRCDWDQTHTPMFHQVEGLVIDKHITFGHLKGCLQEFCDAYFEVENVPLRFRPSYFPFTEPSAEVDIGCSREGGELKIGHYDDWLEILGCGMVHPKVLQYCGIDPEEYQGFAFGMGIERIAMLKYGIPDLRTFYEADIRWLKHYGFVPLEVASLERGLTP